MTAALARSDANESLPATITRIERAIEAAVTPEQIRKVIALADAAVAFANTYFKEQREIIQRAKSVKLQAERKLGEILAAMPKNEGAKGIVRGLSGMSQTLGTGIEQYGITAGADRLRQFGAGMAAEGKRVRDNSYVKPEVERLTRGLKAAFDPGNMLNRGRMYAGL